MRGNLRQSSLADVLRHLYAERKNGVLHLSRAGTNRRIHFKKGVPIYADADDKPFSTRQQAEGLLYSLFTWTSGEFSFQDGEPSVESGSAFTTSPSAVILEGSRRIDDRPTLEYLTGGPSSVYACAQTSVLPLFTMKLHPSESAILAFARERERFTLRDLPMASSATTTVSAVNALVSVGLLEIVEKGTAPPPEAPEAPVASAPAPPPVKPRPVLEPPPTPQPVVAAPPSVPPIRPVRLAPLVETPSPPASSSSPREVAPVLEPAATPGAAGAPSEVEQLLETFEAKRTQTFVAPAPPPSTLPPPEVADAVAEDRPPPTEAPLPSPAVQSLESDSAPPAANEVGEPFESPLDATADSGLAGSPESAESMPVRALPTASPRPTAVTDAIASWIPRGRAAGIGTAILAFVVAAVVLGTWLSSRRD